MAERRGVCGEGHLVPVERPAVMRDGLVIDPAPAAFVVGAGDELSLGAPVVGSGHPHRLRLGPDEAESPVAFELAAVARIDEAVVGPGRSEEHTSELQSLMRISYAVFCLKKKKKHDTHNYSTNKCTKT